MTRERIVSPTAAQAISIVAPGYEVRRNYKGRSSLMPKSPGSAGRDNLWQRSMMHFVTDFNFGDAASKVNPDRRFTASFHVIMNDAMRSVASVKERPTKAGKAMAVIGFIPVLPLLYDVPALVGAIYRRAQGRDFGRVIPYAFMTFFDTVRNVFPTPGSVRSLRLPVYEYQQVSQILLADDMYRVFFTKNDQRSEADLRSLAKYLHVADHALDERKKEVKDMRASVRRLTEAVLTAKGEKWDKKQPLRVLTDDEVQQYLHPQDQVRYFVGQRLSACLDLAAETREERKAVIAQSQPPRRVR